MDCTPLAKVEADSNIVHKDWEGNQDDVGDVQQQLVVVVAELEEPKKLLSELKKKVHGKKELLELVEVVNLQLNVVNQHKVLPFQLSLQNRSH